VIGAKLMLKSDKSAEKEGFCSVFFSLTNMTRFPR